MKTEVNFISQRLKQEFEELKSGKHEDRKFYSMIDTALDMLKKDPFAGIKIPKQLWPKFYVKRYEMTSLWKYDLPNGWRLIYTIETDEVLIVSIVLEWFDHKGYERRFRY